MAQVFDASSCVSRFATQVLVDININQVQVHLVSKNMQGWFNTKMGSDQNPYTDVETQHDSWYLTSSRHSRTPEAAIEHCQHNEKDQRRGKDPSYKYSCSPGAALEPGMRKAHSWLYCDDEWVYRGFKCNRKKQSDSHAPKAAIEHNSKTIGPRINDNTRDHHAAQGKHTFDQSGMYCGSSERKQWPGNKHVSLDLSEFVQENALNGAKAASDIREKDSLRRASYLELKIILEGLLKASKTIHQRCATEISLRRKYIGNVDELPKIMHPHRPKIVNDAAAINKSTELRYRNFSDIYSQVLIAIRESQNSAILLTEQAFDNLKIMHAETCITLIELGIYLKEIPKSNDCPMSVEVRQYVSIQIKQSYRQGCALYSQGCSRHIPDCATNGHSSHRMNRSSPGMALEQGMCLEKELDMLLSAQRRKSNARAHTNGFVQVTPQTQSVHAGSTAMDVRGTSMALEPESKLSGCTSRCEKVSATIAWLGHKKPEQPGDIQQDGQQSMLQQCNSSNMKQPQWQ